MKSLIKIDRIAAWTLLVTIIIYVISGFGLTKGVIDTKLANSLHLHYLIYVLLISFVVHTSYAIHLAFRRWGIWNRAGKILLAIIYVGFFSFILYEANYNPTKQNINSSSVSQTAQNNSTISPSNSSQTTPPSNTTSNSSTQSNTFTLGQLAKYNGKNGQPAYIAVDGIVYDVSNYFVNGNHYGYEAGQDLSSAFHAQHSISYLSNLPIVGKLVK